MSARAEAPPLSGTLVLDLTQFLAGPYATQILGDLGARVVRVEPLEPELARVLPPNFHKGGDSAYFLSANRNKESLSIDLRSEQGKALLQRLVLKADMLIENFRPGVAARLGLDFDTLIGMNPRLVMCSISGFGQAGPYRDRPAYDIIVQAMSGGMSLTGLRGGESVRSGLPLGDLCAGMYGVIGLLAALTKAQTTGRGAYVDVAMLDCQVAMLSYQAAYHLMSGEVPGPQGKSHDSIPTYRSFRCRDGAEIVVAANTEPMWRALCAAIGRPELSSDPRFLKNSDRYRNRPQLDEVLEAAFAARDADDLVAALIAHSVPTGVINSVGEALRDPQVLSRDMVVTLHDGEGDGVRVAGNPIKIRDVASPLRFPPALGEQSRSLLQELAGLDAEEVAALERSGVVRSPLPPAAPHAAIVQGEAR